MRILIFHGYLLHGTGSNVYNARLAAALGRLGHDVHLLSQDADGLDAPGVRTYRPAIGELLPVYVADRYEGFHARPFTDCTDAEIEAYVARNVEAVRAVAERAAPDVALANHLVMGPAILARALDGVPYAVKVHGSALEYTVKRDPERFLPWAREGLAGACAVLVGSRHTAESLWAAMRDPGLPPRTRLGPPGVDVGTFGPRDPADARAGLAALVERLDPEVGRDRDDIRRRIGPPAASESPFARDDAAAARGLARLDPERDRLVAFVGKLIVSKGVDLLAAAWPLVLREVPDARLVVVGFGAYRAALERLLAALAAGDLDGVRALALQGRAPEGGPATPLKHLLAFLDDLGGDERDSYLVAARGVRDRVVLTGRLDHPELAELLPACEAQVVPSTFPEAFGMVAVEGAACAALPVSAAHSGLAEVTRELAGALPEPARPWLDFAVGPRAVRDLAAALTGWLAAPAGLRADVRVALAAKVRERWSWEQVAEGVLAAARGK